MFLNIDFQIAWGMIYSWKIEKDILILEVMVRFLIQKVNMTVLSYSFKMKLKNDDWQKGNTFFFNWLYEQSIVMGSFQVFVFWGALISPCIKFFKDIEPLEIKHFKPFVQSSVNKSNDAKLDCIILMPIISQKRRFEFWISYMNLTWGFRFIAFELIFLFHLFWFYENVNCRCYTHIYMHTHKHT